MTTVAGDTVAALVAADALAAKGEQVTLYLSDRIAGGFEPMRMGPWRMNLGLRLLETSYGPEESPEEPPLSAYVPGMSGHRPYIARVRRWFQDLLGDDLVEVGRPAMFMNGRMAPDVYLTVDLSGLRVVLTDEQAKCIRGETAFKSHLSDHRDTTLEHASMYTHGPAFHDLFIEPFCAKVDPAGSANVLASHRRKFWMPLFHSRTVWEAASGRPVTFQPRRPFHAIRGDGIVTRLLARLDGRVEVVCQPAVIGPLDSDILAYSPETLFAAAGHPVKLDRIQLTICWVSVAEDDIRCLPSTVMIPDPSVSAYRITDGGQVGSQRLVCLEGTTLDRASADLERLGIVREGARLSPVHEMHTPGFAAPTAANRDRFDEARRATADVLGDAVVIGGAGAFGADSLNEQIVQGLWAART